MDPLETIRKIILNTTKSSSELLVELVKTLESYSMKLNTFDSFFKLMNPVIELLRKERTELTIFSNIATKFSSFESQHFESFEDLKKKFQFFLHSLLEINHKTVNNAVVFLKNQTDIENIITISYSSLILETIIKWKPKTVFICESRPLYEGVRLAEDITNISDSMKVNLITDASGPKILLEKTDAVLLGMDCWFSDNSISNKIGSLALALTAKCGNKPVYIIGNSLKKVNFTKELYVQMNYENELKKSYNKDIGENIGYINEYFDIIQSNLITKIIDETDEMIK